MPRPSANQAFSGNSLISEKSLHESYGTLPGHIFSSPMAGKLIHQPVNIGFGDLISKRRRQSQMSNYNRRTYNKQIVQERAFGQYIVQMVRFRILNSKDDYMIVLIFERNLKRKVNVERKIFARITSRLQQKQEDMNTRLERFFRAIEFTRVLFDPERSYPFAQFMNKQILNEIKAKAKISLLQHPKSSSGKSPLAEMRRRSSITIGAMNLESSYKLGNRVSAKTYL